MKQRLLNPIPLLVCFFLLMSSFAISQRKIQQAEYFIDTDPGLGMGITVNASDGSLDDAVEALFKNGISVGSVGIHSFNIRVKDDLNNWGPVFKTIFYASSPLIFRSVNVQQAELFWDTDPGLGNGTSMLAFDGNFNDAIEALTSNLSTLPAVGVHSLNIRVKDQLNNWGPVFKTIVNITSPLVVRMPKISSAELFWDTDPGQGNGTTVLAFDGNFNDAIEALTSNLSTLPAVGVHSLNIRVKDQSNNWGPVFKTTVNITSPLVVRLPKISSAELFWDTDPGQGNGTTVLAFDGNFNSAIEALTSNLATLPAVGVHSLNIRVKDQLNTWGPVFKTTVNITSPLVVRLPKISSAELFWDTDPGQGNGTTVLAFDGNFNDAIEALTSSLSSLPAIGVHSLNIRVKDQSNNWGPVFKTTVNITSPLVVRLPKISSAELFWDTDPGQGNGTTVLAFDGNFNDAIEALTSNLSSLPSFGIHLLNIRVKDIQNNWGPVFRTTVNLTTPLALRNIKVQQAEFYFDVDPGQGSGTSMLAFDGNFDDAIENLQKTWSFLTDTGLHVLNIRACDANGVWGPTFKTVLKVQPCVSQPIVSITPNTIQQICPGDQVTLTAGSGFSTYTWFKGGAIVGTGQTFSADTSGFFRVYAVDNNGCGAFSAFTEVKISYYNANITANGPLTFCQGGNVVLTAASGSVSYNWNTGATTQSITVASSGTFVVTVSNGLCLGTDTVQVIVNPKPATPVITANGPTSFCPGGSVQLTCASPANAYAWNTNEYTPSITVSTQGTYSVTVTDANGCQNSANIAVSIFPQPISSVNSNVNICQGSTGQLFVNGGVSYNWVPATGLNDASISNPIANPSTSTSYKVYVTGLGGCVDSATVNVIVNPAPTVTASASASVLCGGDNLSLTASPAGASSYSWSGPNGYYSAQQNPTINSVSGIHTGTYTVTANYPSGCSNTAYVSVTVNPAPTAFATANKTNLCVGENLSFSALPNGMSYSWTGPNGYASTDQNPVITGVNGANQGTYYLTVSNGSCSSTTSLVIQVAGSLSVTASSNASNLCAGNTLGLTAAANGASAFSWTGPNGFTSTVQNPSIVSVLGIHTGTYTVVASNSAGCTVSSSVSITVLPSPTAFASASSINLCSGETLQLTALPNGMSSYTWSGPNGFNSSLQNPSITNVTGVNQGTYSLTISDGVCSSSNSIVIAVNASPTIVANANATDICEGGVLNLFATPSGGTSYTWSGPSGYSSSNQNPTISNVNGTNSGKYFVTVVNATGCTAKDSIMLTVHPSIAADAQANSINICEGQALSLTGLPSNMVSYTWSGPNGFNSTSQNPIITNVTSLNQGKYFVSLTDGICSSLDSISIAVKPSPSVAISTTSSTLCEGSTLAFTTTTNNGTSFSWVGPNSYTSTDQNPSISNITMANAGQYTVTTTNVDGCSASTNVMISVSPLPAVFASVNSPSLCENETLILSSLPNGMATYDWIGPGGYSISAQNPQISNVTGSNQGVYTVTVNDGICSASASVSVTISSLPVVNASANANNLCEGSVLNLFANPSGAVSYEWSGPSAFVSTLQNPTLSAVTMANQGVYTVTAYNAAGCSASNQITISVTPGITAVISGNSPICEKSDIQLNGFPNAMSSYQWTGPNGFTSTDQNPVIPASGIINAGVYNLTVNSGVCSATSSYNVVVKPAPDVSVNQVGSVLNAVQNSADYQWLNCDNAFAPIVGETFQTFTANTNANYAVTVIFDGCVDTSACFSVTGLGIDEANLNDWLLYPNPATNSVTISNAPFDSDLRILDVSGNLVYDSKIDSNQVNVNVSLLADGVYFVEIISQEIASQRKLVINR